MAKPLHRLTEKNANFLWDEECQYAFKELKRKLTSAPILAYPQPNAQFILCTDARNHGIGALLSPVQNGVEKPIAYSSRTLTKSARNYCVTRRGMLADVEFVKRHRPLSVRSKIIPSNWPQPNSISVRTREQEGQLAQWIEFLLTFDIKFECRAGKRQINADPISRWSCTERCKRYANFNRGEQKTACHASNQTSEEELNQMLLPWSENLNDDVYGEDSLIKNRNPYQIFLTSASRYVAQAVSACSTILNFKLMSMMLNLLKSTKFVRNT